jgi:hypothetical protein
MINNPIEPIFVDSTLKVTAANDLNIEKDLASENNSNKTIAELLDDKEENNISKEEGQRE